MCSGSYFISMIMAFVKHMAEIVLDSNGRGVLKLHLLILP